jgi:hypothetical protein
LEGNSQAMGNPKEHFIAGEKNDLVGVNPLGGVLTWVTLDGLQPAGDTFLPTDDGC